MIRKAIPEDAQSIVSIYNYYVENTTITFETNPASAEEMADRIADISGKYPYFVYEESGRIIGYSYASLWKTRSAYRNASESTVYVDHLSHEKGVGRQLMNALLNELSKIRTHAVIARISLPNPQSVKLHESLGVQTSV